MKQTKNIYAYYYWYSTGGEAEERAVLSEMT